jgi:hypothetical protein
MASNSDVDSTSSEHSDAENEPLPVFRGTWFRVIDPDTFSLPMPDFREDTGPVNFEPGMSAAEYFFMFMRTDDSDIVDLLVHETNRYAEQEILRRSRPPRVINKFSRLHDWHPVTREEMLAFLGIVLSMGIVKKPSYESYWECNDRAWSIETPNFGKIMSRNRFQSILQFLHCNDNAGAPESGEDGYDPLHKISPVIDILNETFGRNCRYVYNKLYYTLIIGKKP